MKKFFKFRWNFGLNLTEKLKFELFKFHKILALNLTFLLLNSHKKRGNLA